MSDKISSQIHIRPLLENDSLEELTDLLHRAYKQLADMGLRFHATFQDVSVTRERVSSGHCFVAELDGQIVGTVTYYDSKQESICEYYRKPKVGHVGQLAVEPSYQGHGIATKLMKHAEKFAAARGITELALDTAEPAKHLIDWYTRLGYRFVKFQQWEITNYRSVIMSKVLGNTDLLV